MERIGVTGAAGFIGSHTCARLLREGYSVVGVDDFSFGSLANIEPCLEHSRFEFEKLDATRRLAGPSRRLLILPTHRACLSS